MESDLTETELKLADFMSEISEYCYSAGWIRNLEYALWHAVINGERKFGQSYITESDIETLIKLSTDANAWIVYDDEKEETALSLKEWAEKFKTDLERNEEIIKG
ncbi:hypothetical protein [Pedobacter roseus]|uniref:Uncharacterized protein n=1 Tax=Pedobacter roseus TaxID=336820 RepID=A0A7G9QNF7_9SPHI|nr:hypothetical protein [Pedobacter roseus]QNN44882.1 hypothetical protein H9L23_12745 [Pedobacter roseus]